jgi:hypothetical protein
MHTYLKWVLVLALPTGLVMAAGSDELNVAESTTIQLLLLRQKSVQKDLKLAPDVARKIVTFTNQEAEAFKKALKLSKEEREKKFAELEKRNRKFIQDNLTAAQRTRLRQIAVQVTGLRHLTRPEVAKRLGLSKKQQKTFREMRKAARTKLEGILEIKDREERNSKLAKLRAEINKKIESVLTAKQKAKARALVGKRFKGKIEIEEPE